MFSIFVLLSTQCTSGVGLCGVPDLKLFSVGLERSILSGQRPSGVQLVFFFCARLSMMLFGAQSSFYRISESSFVIHHVVVIIHLFVLGLWQDKMAISTFSYVQKQCFVVKRQFMPQRVVHGGTKPIILI